jgi:carbamoylphosphate synthase large subunit
LKKRVLVAGGSYSDIPIINKAKELGYFTITSGNNEAELGHKYSDEYHKVDYSNKEALLQLAKKLNIDAIVPSCHDLSMVSCAYVAEQLNLKGYDSYDTTLDLHHKDRFKNISDDIGLKTPKVVSYNTLQEAIDNYNKISIPVIIKPVDLGGGKGITIVENKDELHNALSYAFDSSKSSKVVVEEFVKGDLKSLSTFIKNQKVIFCFENSEFASVNPFGVSSSSSPSYAFENVKDELIQETQKIAKALNLKDGLLHLQYLRDGNNISIIEFTRRMSGDWYSLPISLSNNIDHVYWILQGFLGNDFENFPTNATQKGYFSRYCLMAPYNGNIDKLYIDDSIKNKIVDSFVWLDDYDKVEDFLYQKFGLFFLKYKSYEEMENLHPKLSNLIKIQINN